MSRKFALPLLVASTFVLGGCAAGLAANALGMAVQAAQGKAQSNAHLKPVAREACSAHAAQYGAVHVIDVEQRSTDKIIVWGTADDGKQRLSFECAFGTKITGFKLRPIPRR